MDSRPDLPSPQLAALTKLQSARALFAISRSANVFNASILLLSSAGLLVHKLEDTAVLEFLFCQTRTPIRLQHKLINPNKPSF